MKAIAVEYEGIKFRSKLEARWYIFMKKLGWNIIYEPEIEGINGWIPDFLIIGRSHKTLVDVKGINRDKEWCECVWSRAKNEAIIKSKHKDYDKILNSGIKDLHDYELLILGANLRLDGNSAMGILHTRAENYDENGVSTKLNDLYRSSETVFSCVDKKIGFMDHEGVWCCRITGEGGKTYIFRRNGYDDADDDYEYKFIDKAWNESWSKLQWKGK
jgi:hypothetical protein